MITRARDFLALVAIIIALLVAARAHAATWDVPVMVWNEDGARHVTPDIGGSCPKPLPAIVKHHKKHVAAVPLCTCVPDAPRTIMLTAPEPDIDAIPLSVYPYYTIISANDEPPAATFEDWEPGYYGYYGWATGIGTSHTTMTAGQGFRRSVGPPTPRVQQTPEIGADSAGAALTLLAGALAVMRGRRSNPAEGGK